MKFIFQALLILFQFNIAKAGDFESLVPACSEFSDNGLVQFGEFDCKQKDEDTNKLPQNLNHYQKIINHLGEDVLLNPDDLFFLEFKQYLARKIKNNLEQMRIISACTSGTQKNLIEKFNELGFKPKLIKNSNRICSQILQKLRENVARHWPAMREGLELGFNSKVSAITQQGYLSVSSRAKLSFQNIPLVEGARTHKIRGHLGKGYEGKISPMIRSEQFRVNELLFQEMTSIALETSWYKTPRSEIEKTIQNLNKIHSREPQKKIIAFKEYLNNLPQDQILGSGHQSFASKWSSSVLPGKKKSVKERYREQYFQTLQSASPLLPYMEAPYPSDKNINEATELFIKETESFLKGFEPGSDDPIKLKDMANFLPAINDFVSQNPHYCSYTKMWITESIKMEKSGEFKRMAVTAGLGVACVGSLFFTPTGAPVLVCGAGLGTSFLDYSRNKQIARQLAGETRLNTDQLEARSFRDLNYAQQQEVLSLALMALDTAGFAADGAKLFLSTSTKLSPTPKLSSIQAEKKSKTSKKLIKTPTKTEPLFDDVPLGGDLPGGGILRAAIKDDKIAIYTDPTLLKTKSKEIEKTLRKSRSDINKLAPQKINQAPTNLPSLKNKIMANIEDENLRRGFSDAFDKMHSTRFLEDYTRQLKADVLQSMLISRDEKLIKMALNGEIHRGTMQSVLEARAAARGQNIAVIKMGLTDTQFRQYIGRGAIIDEGFGVGSKHGIWTHMVQQDMTYDVILKTSGKSIQELEDFWKTKSGFEVWREMYDGFSTNTTNPENFGRRFVQPVLNLTQLSRDSKPIV